MNVNDVDVLIVGAGPVGLFLANECARRGLTFRIVERKVTQSQHSKALAVFPRTMEIFDMAGLVEPFLRAANPVSKVSISSEGRLLGRVAFAPPATRYPYVAMVPQSETERILTESLRNRGYRVEYETALTAVEQHAKRVVATLVHANATQHVGAKFLIGCVGASRSDEGRLLLGAAGRPCALAGQERRSSRRRAPREQFAHCGSRPPRLTPVLHANRTNLQDTSLPRDNGVRRGRSTRYYLAWRTEKRYA
jgi:flavin-dependent dehydrogenase